MVKGEWVDNAFNVLSIEPSSPLARHAEKQIGVWGSVGVHLLKMGQRELSLYPPPFVSKDTFTFTRADFLDPDGDINDVSATMRLARRVIMNSDKSFATDELTAKVEGLTSRMLDKYAGEYGLERTEEGEWTVNEAIDDDTVETKENEGVGSPKFGLFPGQMDLLTAPRGPTSLVDDEGIPMFNPNGMAADEPVNLPNHIKVQTTDGKGESIEGELDIEEGRAVMRVPPKTNVEEAEENDVIVEQDDDQPQMPIM